jgi:hypothetical protein
MGQNGTALTPKNPETFLLLAGGIDKVVKT